MDKINLKYLNDSKQGLKRNRNQDASFILSIGEYYFFIIFDGVSSRPNSYLFIKKFKTELSKRLKNFNSINNLSKILFNTHNEILDYKIDGLTTMALLIINTKSFRTSILSIGDSRIYSFTNQFLEKLTKDDSLEGRKNVITKCLGMDSLTLEDFYLKEFEFVNNFLICTDGFYSLMENNLKEYFATINFKSFKNIKKKIYLLQDNQNIDDSSYIIVKNEI